MLGRRSKSRRESRGLEAVGLLATLITCVGACSPEVAAGPSGDSAASYIACQDPRPEVCTREYRPVCAQRDTGVRCVTTPCDSSEWVSRSNACTACSDPKVLGYRPGACPEEP